QTCLFRSLGLRIAGDADDRAWKRGAGGGDVGIVTPEVHAIGARFESERDGIVDDERNAGGAAGAREPARLVQRGRRPEALRAVLHDARAALEALLHASG